jgi:cell wall-associated NlpC family hydrolase
VSAPKPMPGDIGLYHIPGLGGFAIGLGQRLLGDSSYYTHAFLVVDDTRTIAAQPGGARYDDLSYYPEALFSTGRIPLTPEQRDSIVAEATKLLGTPYSWLDYLAIGMHRFGLRFGFVERRIMGDGHMICSQLVDEVYRRAGISLFTDGRLPQDVTPGDIDDLLFGGK